MAASGWGAITPKIEPAERTQILEEVAATFKGRPLEELRQEPEKLIPLATQGIRAAAGRRGLQISEADVLELAREVVARVGGLGFLAPLLRLDSGMSEIALNRTAPSGSSPRANRTRAFGYPPFPE